ncbi:signal peptidase I [Cellulomonas sp. NPDC089187]|uniref:signal peptidase I n=1 Tax=Cellulomonas sp. NPDC089187 TaxID=3154970 RepID=UPI0034302593
MSGSHSAPATPGRGWRRVADLTREVLLTVAAVFGAVCGVVIVLVVTLDLGVIVFRTGSMSPTIPTGSAALVREVPAQEVRVGDVVTVPSPLGPLPVTHRVISTEPLSDGQVRLHLRGDANDAEDPFPYDVSEVRRVVAHAPGIGFALVRLDDPLVLGGVTVLVAGLILWALWPSSSGDRGRSRRSPAPVAGVLIVAGGLLWGPSTPVAQAVEVPEPVTTTPPPGGYLEDDGVLALSSSLPTGEDWTLEPGTDLLWRVTSSARPPEDADAARGWLWVSLVAGGPLVELDDAIRLTLRLCDGGWAADGDCPDGARDIPAPADQGVVLVDRASVGALTTERPQQVAVRLQVADDLPDSAQGQDMYLGLRFDAFGDSVIIDEGGEVPPQGGEDPGPDDPDHGGAGPVVGAEPGGTDTAEPGGLAITGADLRPATWAALALLIGSLLLSSVRERRDRRLHRAVDS